jgi:hypothetical protein
MDSIRRFAVAQLFWVLSFVMSAASTAFAQSPAEFERVLLPICVSRVPGAYGTLWSTELWYRNNSEDPVAILPLAVSDYVPTIGQTVLLPVGSFPASAPGQILFVERRGGSAVQFDLRLLDESNPAGAWGTKLPVVRETELGRTVSLINIPTGFDFRSALRIYGVPDDPGGTETVRVRIYSGDEDVLVDEEIVLTGFPRYGAILSLADAFPEIRHAERVRIHVEAVNPNARIWAFVGVTSNHTQNVSIVTPN